MKVYLSYFKIMFFFLGMFVCVPSIAASVDWNLKFFDETGQLVGQGEFSYDPSTTICIEVSSPVGCQPTITDGMLVSNYITSLSITFDERDFETNRGNFWWNDPAVNVSTGSVLSGGRDGPQGIIPSWEFLDFYYLHYYRDSFRMSGFTEISKGYLWTGSWFGNEYDEQFSIYPSYSGRGSFTVTKVPVPTSILLFVSGFAFLFRYKNKL